MHAPYTIIDIEAWIEVEGAGGKSDKFPISEYQSVFALNEIPQAVVVLSEGIDADSGDTSNAHSILVNNTKDLKVKVKANYKLISSDKNKDNLYGAPEGGGTIDLFVGRIAGPDHSVSAVSRSLSLRLIHWLNDLNSSSMFSDTSHPANPFFYTYPVGISDASGDNAPLRTTDTAAELFITPENIKNDVWGNTLWPWFNKLCERDSFGAAELGLGLRGSQATNAIAKEALSYMNSAKFPKLKLSSDLASDAIANAIAQRLRATCGVGSQIANYTIWNLLITALTSELYCAVVPRINDAGVVPFVFNQKSYIDVWQNEYSGVTSEVAIHRPVKGVIVYSSADSQTNIGSPGIHAVGVYPEPDVIKNKNGIILTKPAPPWAQFVRGLSTWTSQRAVAPIKDAVNNDPDVVSIPESSTSVMDKIAKTIFLNELVQDRGVAIMGSLLRFDITPGTSVLLKKSDLPGGVPVDKLGTVVSVTHMIKQANPTPVAITNFSIRGFRTIDEATKLGYTAENHPIYDKLFNGIGFYD
jgi:hypothetical protein